MSHDNRAQRTSKSFVLPVEDKAFLLSDEMRPLRFAMEYAKAELALRKAGIVSTIVVFGSARAPSPEQLERWRAEPATAPDKASLKRLNRHAVYYERAREFGKLVSLRGGALLARQGCGENVIATGGGPGIMEAANRGALEVGAPSIGFNIRLPAEQEPNAFSTPELTFQFHYFAMRKMHLAMRANALAVFPGGFGTMDELFEILTLLQTRKSPPIPVVLFGEDYWRRIVNFDALVEEGAVTRDDLQSFEFVEDAEQAWEVLCRRGLHAHVPPPGHGRSAAGAQDYDPDTVALHELAG